MKEKVLKLHEAGYNTKQIAEILGVKSPAISWHKRTLGIPVQIQGSKRNWESIQSDIDAGLLHREICNKHNISISTLSKAYKKGWVRRSPLIQELSAEEYANLWVGKRPSAGFANSIRRRLVNDGVWHDECHSCGLTEWLGKPAPLELDHIDGDKTNNTLMNLRLLCRNCHYFTPTWGNKKRL